MLDSTYTKRGKMENTTAKRHAISIAVSMALLSSVAIADDHDSLIVNATRLEKPLYSVPASVSIVDQTAIQSGKQQLGLDESLVRVPGVFMQNRYNFAQDLRISIRGFGSRATFGIRGIKLYVDGIPATLPDGQGGVDSIDIGSIQRMEVIRGPSSSLYGAAAGGVINMYTESGPRDKPFVEGRVSIGSYDFTKVQLKAGGQKDKLNYLVSISHTKLGGYRDHSGTKNVLFNSKFRYDIDGTSDLTLTLNAVDSPKADDPGGLRRVGNTFNVDLTNPTDAQRNNLRFDTGESVKQQQIGLLYNKTIGEKHELRLRNYYVFRDFDNRLPFGDFSRLGIVPSGGVVELDRFFVGGGAQYSYSDALLGHKNHMTVGVDIDSQQDERVNFTNIVDSPVVGPKSLDQDEEVFSWGIYLQNEFSITDSLELSAGIRYDEIKYDFKDHYFVDVTDDSGKIRFSEWSPQAGLSWQVNTGVNLFANISTSFEVPSSREFANPTAAGGFNSSLTAQTAINYEVGVKGSLSQISHYEVSLFKIKTDDELVLAGTNPAGSDFFENAGETIRKGLEASVTFEALKNTDMTMSYTYSDFEFDNFTSGGTSFSGNALPGIPEQTAFVELAYQNPQGYFVIWDTQYVSEVTVDNANSDAAASYSVSNLRAGFSSKIGNSVISPFIGINNIFDKQYIGAVRVNESRSRFFEPAPELNVFVGLSIRFQ
ncbi:MAG: TonB-dependent receptor [Piscirickettsiaceae bacterium]|nr:MAG: TonB-dependent receptor [Piscirickettsiaceae bacterium]